MPSLVHRASFYVVHHYGFLDPFLDADEHSLEDCATSRYLQRSETIAETAFLFHQTTSPFCEPPIFLCLCHSPWGFLSQKRLLLVRGTLAVYLAAVLALQISRECHGSHAQMFAFDARNIVWAMQVIYYLITTVCIPQEYPATSLSEAD